MSDISDAVVLAEANCANTDFQAKLVEFGSLILDLKQQIDKQNTIYNAIVNADKDLKLLTKKVSAKDAEIWEKLEANNKSFSKNVEDFDLLLHALDKIPSMLDEKIINITPKIAKKITECHENEMTEFRHNINACNNELNLVAQSAEKLQNWHAKKIAMISIAAIFLATLSASIATYFIFKLYPPTHETRILKANNVHTSDTVYIFDMAGKFCSKAKIIPNSK